jgi:hypothetical protein
MTTEATTSPLRHNGIYLFRGREYTAVHLSTPEQPWRSTGLMVWSADADGPRDIMYLRHDDGVLIGYRDFAPLGTLADLTDTGRDGAE